MNWFMSNPNLYTRAENRRNQIIMLKNAAISASVVASFYGFISLTNDDPETAPVIHFVQDTALAQCMPENDAVISILKVKYHRNGTPYISCEMHEPMGYGMVPPKAVHIKVAVNTQAQR